MVFADALLERGLTARAALIGTRLPPPPALRRTLAGPLDRWLRRPDADEYLRVTWRHGYIVAADVRTPKAIAALLSAPAAWLLQSLTLRAPSSAAPERVHAAAPPHLRHLDAVCRGPHPLNLAAARAVLTGQGLALETVRIAGVRFDVVLQAAVEGPTLADLRRLTIAGGALDAPAADWLLHHAPRFAHLECLDLSRHQGPLKDHPALRQALPNLRL